RNDEKRQGHGTESHGDVGQSQWINAGENYDGAGNDRDRVDEAETIRLPRPQVFSPVPAESLRRQIGERERHFQRRSPARDAERGDKEWKSPSSKRVGEHECRLSVLVYGDGMRRQRERGHDQYGGSDEPAEQHSDSGHDAVDRNVRLVPI